MSPSETARPARVLIIAGSDSGGGAGIQADIKTVTALGGYAMTAVTALTAQNTRGVHGIHPIPPGFIAEQIACVLEDLGADAVKLGMLHSAEVIEAVSEALNALPKSVPVVADPVMVAKGGARLLREEAVAAVKDRILPMATLITPNVHEAEDLTGQAIRTEEDAVAAGRALAGSGQSGEGRHVLLTGGHLDEASERVTDFLVVPGGEVTVFRQERIATPHTHGTGCTVASACAVGLAQGRVMAEAVSRARAYVLEAIRTNPGLGTGHGPLNHGHTVKPFEPRIPQT